MKTKPKIFQILSITFALIATSLPLQIFLLYSHNFSELSLVFMKLSILNILLATALYLNAYLLWQVSPWLKLSIPSTLLILAWNNYVVGSYGQDFNMLTTSLATLTFAMVCTPLLSAGSRTILHQPYKRWWMTPKRLNANLPLQIQPHVGQNVLAECYDISESGVYIPFNSCRSPNDDDCILDPALKVGDLTTLQIRLSQFNVVKCEARVVRKAESTPSHPAGMGLHFINIDSSARSQIKKLVSIDLH